MTDHGDDQLSDEERELLAAHRARRVAQPATRPGDSVFAIPPTPWYRSRKAKVGAAVAAVSIVAVVASGVIGQNIINSSIDDAESGNGSSSEANAPQVPDESETSEDSGVALTESQLDTIQNGTIEEQNSVYDEVFYDGITYAVLDYSEGITDTVDMSELSGDPAVSDRMKFLVDKLVEDAGEKDSFVDLNAYAFHCPTVISSASNGICTTGTTEYVGTDSGEIDLLMQVAGPGSDFDNPSTDHYAKYKSGLIVQVDGDQASIQLAN